MTHCLCMCVCVCSQPSWRRVVALCVATGVPVPSFSASLSYFDTYRRERLPANLTQAQRDFFGAHTYERVDRPGKVSQHMDAASHTHTPFFALLPRELSLPSCCEPRLPRCLPHFFILYPALDPFSMPRVAWLCVSAVQAPSTLCGPSKTHHSGTHVAAVLQHQMCFKRLLQSME